MLFLIPGIGWAAGALALGVGVFMLLTGPAFLYLQDFLAVALIALAF